MLNKNIFILTLTLLGILCICNAQTKLINGITYEKIDSKWYKLYYGLQFEVSESIITVKFDSVLNENQKNQIVQINNCTIVRSNSLGYYDLEITNNTSSLEVVENFISNPFIEMAEPNAIGEFVDHANDTYYYDQWHLLLEDEDTESFGIDAFKAWDKENGNSDVVIGILDSGTDILHEDLERNIWVNPGEDLDGDGVVWDSGDMNGIDDDGNGLVDDLSGWDFANNSYNVVGTHWHGTHVAGVVGAETNDLQGVSGIAGGWGLTDDGVSMLICQIGNIYVSEDVVDDAILYAADKGAKIITLSILITPTQAVAAAINSVVINDGCFVNCCSGNYPPGDHSVRFPASIENCFAVGGSDVFGLRSSFSCYGEGLMVVAGGTDIKSTLKNNTYGIMSGTSFASPQVGATAGLILSRFTDFTPKDIEEVICLTAMKLPGYTYNTGFEYGDWNEEVGYGKLNVDRALGIKEDIVLDIILEEGNYIRDEVHVSNNSTLTISDESRFFLLKDGELIVDDNSTLVIGTATKITGKGKNKIIIYGDLQIGSFVCFYAEEAATLEIEIRNPELITTIYGASFANVELIIYNNQTSINFCTFNNSRITAFDGSLLVNETDFLYSSIYAQKVSESNKTVNITNCDFVGIPSLQAIRIENYPNFFIQNSSISEYRDAISLYNCGYGEIEQSIIYNDITENTGTGITIYRTFVDILHNTIENNNIGIRCFDRSNVHIEGEDYYTSQRIRDNDTYEILASKGSFPYYLHWNLIEDDDNAPGDPIVKYTGAEEGLDVVYNCWGDVFNPHDDLDPLGAYIWDPVWDCNTGMLPAGGSEAEAKYLTAKDKVDDGDYASAQAEFQQIVILYPTTNYAQAALKEVYTLEVFVNNDYSDLKTYYNTEPNISNNPELSKLSDFLVNFCEIKLENWPTAIAWFENIIQNHESIEDSIFAIIDMGYTYWLMENSGLKSNYVGTMPQYKFTKHKDYEENRDYLLSLLPGDVLSETMKQSLATLKPGELLQNVPNPFNGTTQIWFKLAKESHVSVIVFDYTGKEVSRINPGIMDKGSHSVEFISINLPSGIYFYALEVNGIKTDTKKMIIIN